MADVTEATVPVCSVGRVLPRLGGALVEYPWVISVWHSSNADVAMYSARPTIDLARKHIMSITSLHPKPILVVLGVAMLMLSGCGAAVSGGQPPAPNLPDFVRDAPPTVKEAYAYAAAHSDELTKYPCYCGCGAMGHTSNRSCYIKDIAANGGITFDNHAAGCGICVDITKDVMRLKAQGQSSRQVRAYIDAQYSAYGPSTNTPLPQD
jgi:hypothetical protein